MQPDASAEADPTAILLTPAGAAAIAVVRINGSGVGSFLQSHLSATPRVGRAVHGELRDGERVIDDPVVVLIDETTADINLHGGPWVVRATLELLSRNGFKTPPLDSNATLPAQAVDADEPIWQEVLAALPRAKTELAVRTLLAQPAAWAKLLSSPIAPTVAADLLADRTVERMLSTPRVAIVGPANVGKSTLANRLFGRERSITADLPGTTRDWVGELANLDGIAVMLVDTPGLRQSDDAIEQAAIASARTQIAAADVVVVLLDATRPIDAEERSALAAYPDAIVAINKADVATEPVASANAVRISARTGDGVRQLVDEILRRLGCCEHTMVSRPRCWTDRQRSLL